MTTKSLEEHLAFYGLRHFSFDSSDRAGLEFDEKTALELDRLRQCVTRPGAKNYPEKIKKFYDILAQPDLASVIHSMKADAIRASGEAVAKRLAGRKNILDLGCATGYLSTWYALSVSGREVTGVDFSEKSIEEAGRKAVEQKIENVRFRILNICETGPGAFEQDGEREAFDVIVDTQTIQMTRNIPKTFANVRAWLNPGGLLVSVPVLETARHARAFTRCLTKAGFKLQSFDFIDYEDHGNPGGYPVLTAALEGLAIDVNLEEEYERMWQRLNPMGAGSPGER